MKINCRWITSSSSSSAGSTSSGEKRKLKKDERSEKKKKSEKEKSKFWNTPRRFPLQNYNENCCSYYIDQDVNPKHSVHPKETCYRRPGGPLDKKGLTTRKEREITKLSDSSTPNGINGTVRRTPKTEQRAGEIPEPPDDSTSARRKEERKRLERPQRQDQSP